MVETLNLFEETAKTEGISPAVNKKRRRNKKSDSAYRTISEVAKSLNVATHVLRFWETKFSEIQPMKRSGGRRYYRPEDIAIIKNIQNLLHNKGYTIKGVQAVLNKTPEPQQHSDVLPTVLDKLYKLRNILAA